MIVQSSVGVIRTFSTYFSELIGRLQQQNGILAFLSNIRNMLSYPEEDEDVLKDINLKIASGEKLALIGLNGAGKTTMVKLICGFYEPTAALEPIAENELYQNFGKAAGDNTVLFIFHRLSSTRFCDRIILLEGSHIIEEGTHRLL